MFTGKFLLAAIVIAIADIVIQWFFIGFLFHRYQAMTPTVWRKESSRSYTLSSVLSFLFALVFTTIISLWIRRYGTVTWMDGLGFSGLCWLAFVIPREIGSAIYINVAPMFVVGKCLSGLAECFAAAMISLGIFFT